MAGLYKLLKTCFLMYFFFYEFREMKYCADDPQIFGDLIYA